MNKLITFFTVFAGWFRIVMFPVLICLIVSLLVYLTLPAAIGLLLCILLCLCGLITGIIIATRRLIQYGPSYFIPAPEEVQEENNAATEENEKPEI